MKHKLFSWVGIIMVVLAVIFLALAVGLILGGNEGLFLILFLFIVTPSEFLGLHPDVALIAMPILGLVILYFAGWSMEQAYRRIFKSPKQSLSINAEPTNLDN